MALLEALLLALTLALEPALASHRALRRSADGSAAVTGAGAAWALTLLDADAELCSRCPPRSPRACQWSQRKGDSQETMRPTEVGGEGLMV